MSAKFTPGPWATKAPSWDVYDSDGFTIAEVYPLTFKGHHTEANARLIAAAPDLLEACNVAIRFCENRGGSWSEFEAVIRSAISKATA